MTTAPGRCGTLSEPSAYSQSDVTVAVPAVP